MKIITNFFYFFFIILMCSSQVYTQNVIKILNLGNSITHGEQGFDSYRRRLAQKLDSANIAYDMVGSMNTVFNNMPHLNEDFDTDHEGHWAWRADEIINGRTGQGKLSEWIQYYDIDFVLMRIGTNDLIQGQTNENILDELEQIITILRVKNPKVVVFLSNFTPNSYPNNDKIIPFNALLPDFVRGISTANSPVILVDQYTGFSLADNYDGIHPNLVGEEKMAQKWLEAIVDYLETRWTGDTDNDWLTASNWSNGVPDNKRNVFIPTGLANYPILSSAVECNNLVIESTSVSTGSLIGQQHLTVHGTVIVERHMSGNAWHLVSSPAPGQTISSFLTENTNIPTISGERGMMDYDQTNNNWYPFFTDATVGDLSAGKGFCLRTDADGIVSFFGGSLASGMVNAAVTASGERWNAVGNPFPSSIYINDAAHTTNNFIEINFAKFDPSYVSVYVWEQYNSAYTIINQGDDAYTAAMGQAFMVRANTSVTTFEFNTNMQTHAPAAKFKSASVAWPEAKLIVENQENELRYAKIRFNDSMNKGLDPGYDAGVFKTGFDIYTQLLEDNGVDFGVQYLPMFGIETFEIPVGINSRMDGEISFSFDSQNLPLGIVPVLNDKLKGEKYIFDTGIGVYTTTVNENTSGYGRFTITFTTATDIKDIQEQKLKAWYSNYRINVSGNITPGARAKLLNIQGQVLLETRLKNVNHSSLDVSDLAGGIYLLQIENEGWRQIIKIPVTN